MATHSTVTKLSGMTGEKLWSRSVGEPQRTLESIGESYPPYQPIRLTHLDGKLFFIVPSAMYGYMWFVVTDGDGNVLRKAALADVDAGRRGSNTDPRCVTRNTIACANIVATPTHVCISIPKLRTEWVSGYANKLPDGGDVWAIPTDAIYPTSVNTAFSITPNAPPPYQEFDSWSWEDAATVCTGITIEASTVIPSIDIGDMDSHPFTSTGGFVYPLPPMTNVVTPSLDVKNIASVGQLIVGNDKHQPTSLRGNHGDKAGMVRFGTDGIYYCFQEYSGNGDDIWSFAPFSPIAYPKYKEGPIGSHATTQRLIGIPGDIAGDIRVCSECLFTCRSNYNGNDTIWYPSTPYYMSDEQVTTTVSFEEIIDPAYPSGFVLSSFYQTIKTGGAADVAGGCVGKPAANATIMTLVVPRRMRLTYTNAAPWYCGISATTQQFFYIKVNGYQIGSMYFSAGQMTANCYQSWDRQLEAGDRLTVHVSTVQDATLSDIYFTLTGILV